MWSNQIISELGGTLAMKLMTCYFKHTPAILTGMLMISAILLSPMSNSLGVVALEKGFALADTGSAVSNGEPLFNATFGTSDNEEATSLIQVTNGGFAIAGNVYGKAHEVDYWLVRTDENGAHLWNQSFDAGQTEYCRAVIECDDGGFALFGITKANPPTSSDFWIVRTNATGGHLWNSTFGTDNNDDGYDIIESSDGGFVMAGYFKNSTTNDFDYLLIKADQDGNHLWNATFGGLDDDYCYSLIESNDGGFVLAGALGTPAGDDMLIIRVDQTGNYLWNFTDGGALNDYAYDIIRVSGGGYAITGSTESFGVTGADLWLVRLDADGNRLWNRTHDGGFGDDEGRSLTEMSDDGFAVVGDIAVDGGGTSPWLLRTGNTGLLIWNKTYGVTGDLAESITIVEEGGMAFAGATANLGAGGTDMWLLLVPELAWVDIPSDMTIGMNDQLNRNLNAVSAAGIASWSLNDTTHFQIDGSGVLTNATSLDLGSYGLIVTVTDTNGNQLVATITITVLESVEPTEPTEPGPTNGTPTIPGIEGGAIAAIALVAVVVVVTFLVLIEKGIISRELSFTRRAKE
jgi:hypothetical protein